MKIKYLHCLFAALLLSATLPAQRFYFGSDLSYVNEMQDCGVVYRENGAAQDPYELFASHRTNLVRLRLWHTPSWYDTLNAGKRYSDFNDVRRSIIRTKAAGMEVLLDFHLSDTWADPGRQIAPQAWWPVVNNLPVLQDSLYNYVSGTLLALHADGLLPDMVQIGNETNRGILLSPQDDAAGWQLNWPRNSALFKRAIEAVRDVEKSTGKKIKIALHLAGPADTGQLMEGFWNNGVQDFDIIGMSYYWAWHKPTTIADAGAVMGELKRKYPGKEVIIFETGYIWTLQNNDQASNIISETHPDFAPPSPQNQLKWLTELTQMAVDSGGIGVVYWEPAWVSSGCRTPWGKGSHQEHATFFDFSNNVLPQGGMIWPEQTYRNLPVEPEEEKPLVSAYIDSSLQALHATLRELTPGSIHNLRLFSVEGRLIGSNKVTANNKGVATLDWPLPQLRSGVYFLTVDGVKGKEVVRKLWVR